MNILFEEIIKQLGSDYSCKYHHTRYEILEIKSNYLYVVFYHSRLVLVIDSTKGNYTLNPHLRTGERWEIANPQFEVSLVVNKLREICSPDYIPLASEWGPL